MKKDYIVCEMKVRNLCFERATLAEKEVTTLKEQLATNTPQSQLLQATIPTSKTNGTHDQSKQLEAIGGESILGVSADEVEELEASKMEAARTGNSHSSTSSPMLAAAGNKLEIELAAKEKEISQLVEDVQRLQASLASLQEAHAQQLQRLEERLDEKRQHIARLEARLDCQRDYEEIKREVKFHHHGSLSAPGCLTAPAVGEQSLPPRRHQPAMSLRLTDILRSVDLTTPTADTKQYQQMVIDRSKSQSEPLKSPAHTQRERDRESLERERPIDRRDTGGVDSDERMPHCTQVPVRHSISSRGPHILSDTTWRVASLSAIGKEGAIPGFPRPEGDMNDERLAHILTEASHLMKNPGSQTNEDSRSNEDSGSPRTQCPSPFSNKDSSQNRRLKKYENDDIPQEKVVRIYHEELAKLMGRRMDDMRQSRDGFPGAGMHPHMERPQDDNIRMALEAYHRELAKIQQGGGNMQNMHSVPGMSGFPGLLALQQQAMQQAQAQHQAQQQVHNPHVNGSGVGVQDLSLPKEKTAKINGMTDLDKEKAMDAEEAIRHAGSAFSLVRPKVEPGSQQSTGSSASSPLGNAILPPAITPNDDFGGSASASPLQRMASITNSLISQPQNPTHHTPSQRPMKAVLPPITQQQFDLFNNLNTEDIVRRVKESLSQYSISQRLFGESVLGLSQGSVSDLLARPKPWHMLTQKGREPFIRMKMFLEDDNAVHKLVASQYKIAPEKLMRTGSYGGAPPCPPNMNKPLPPTPKMISDATQLLNKMQQEQQALLPPSMQLGPPPQGPPSQSPMLLTPPGFPPHHAITLPQPPNVDMKPNKPPMQHPIQHSPLGHQQSSVMRALHQHISPSVYEMAALTQDLDTQTITTKIKEALLANNIGQKIFGEAVLGLSQGSVSELLSKPKPWHMLSIKGREPFIRMQLWLSDAHNIDRLQALKNERREANKRRRSTGPGAQDNSSDTSSNDTSEFYHSNSPGPNPSGPPSAKKQRVLFSEEQKEALRLAFALDPYPNMPTIEFLATELGLSTRTITNWFHNHRMRLKQQVPHGMPNEMPVRDQSGNQAPFDPVQFRLLLNQRLLELQKERMGLAGVPLPYPPYFAANSNIAALISRGLLPSGEMDLAALNNAVKEQMSGLDLSMPALKREPDGDDFEDDDVESNLGSEDSMDDRSLIEGDGKLEPKMSSTPINLGPGGRSSRRKPAAPQWVNPDWQDDKDKPPNPDEVIINGVCVMQTEDYGIRSAEETVRIEPVPVMDRFAEEDNASESSDITNRENREVNTSSPTQIKRDDIHSPPKICQKKDAEVDCNEPKDDTENLSVKDKIKTESEDDRWEY